MVRGVDPHVLDPAAPDGVGHDVQSERPAMTQPELAVHPHHEPRGAEVPQTLVQERRMERVVLAVAGDPVRRVDLQPPRQVGRPAVELLVEVVPPPSDPLCDHDGWCEGVGQRGEPDAVPATPDVGTERTERHRAPDPQSAAPDVERGPRVLPRLEVQLRVGDHVVQPGSDQSERHRPDRDVTDGAGTAAPLPPPPVAVPDRDDDAEEDAQRVRPDRDRAEVPHRLRRARDRRESHCFASFSMSAAISSTGVCRVQKTGARSPRNPITWVLCPTS